MWDSLRNFGNALMREDADVRNETRFDRLYKCYSASVAGKPELERGNKILLPPSALQALARLNVSWPMLFELTHGGRKTHCGVLEFVAEEGCCNLPYWMMQNLCVDEGGFVNVINTSLPKGTFVKLQPVTSDFLEISNPKAVLENSLRHFATLTVGDCIALSYNDRIYEIEIIETRPANAISIIETDVDVDFAPPKDYVEPPPPAPAPVRDVSTPGPEDVSESSEDDLEPRLSFVPFGGQGTRLDGASPISPNMDGGSKGLDEPWHSALPNGVRISNKRYNDLLSRGLIKPWSSTYSAYKQRPEMALFQGAGRRLQD
eukprot:Protomagalhaensia_wolfi_Nauph_80__3759@NODE_37_length_4469_cov_110_624153_g29_i0_p2_GENE_NODE_37_length_4469_cov_110_624153_g29_i0NODE_37_length_4469_cov_110_624153_g29_i0_p2_ORF_typecomplete_len317_score36_37UFD1/PF03152_14/8_1e64Fanconi_A/PF03511_14/0_11_NODE_37_length_4469_cov_110_624153_g29_i07291679